MTTTSAARKSGDDYWEEPVPLIDKNTGIIYDYVARKHHYDYSVEYDEWTSSFDDYNEIHSPSDSNIICNSTK